MKEVRGEESGGFKGTEKERGRVDREGRRGEERSAV